MTSPAAIAQRLTPAQVRALKEPMRCEMSDWIDLCLLPYAPSLVVFVGDDFCNRPELQVTTLGLAVLTELERMGK